MGKKKRWFKLNLYMLFWILIIVAFAVASAQQYAKYKRHGQEKNAVLLELAAEKEKTDELNRQMLYYESDKYIEQVAREKLGLVYPDEVLFYDGSTQKP